MDQSKPEQALKRIALPLRLTLLGLWAERLTRAFWPLWTVVIAALGLLSFGVLDQLPLEAGWFGLISLLVGMAWALIHGLRTFRRPTRDEAMTRLDATMPGRPLAALRDTQAIGADDPMSQAVWAAHRARMASRAADARAVEPDLKLATRDPYALRYMALTVLIIGLTFGSIWRVASLSDLTPGGTAQAATGPAWEGWARPPAYTGKPALYLADLTDPTLTLPAGTQISLRLYGEPGSLILAETVSGRTDAPPASQPTQDFTVTRAGTLAIEGTGGREWQIALLPDAPPAIEAVGDISREADGRFKQAFTATDDYGVTKGEVTIALDLPATDRRYGLTPDPEATKSVTLDLPLSMKRDRRKIDQTLIDDLSKDLLANLPVTMVFQATDAAGQTAQSQPLKTILPGRRFFDPLAAALIEMRRDLLWNRANAPRVVQVLKAVTNEPEGFIRNEKAYLRLRVLIGELSRAATTLDPEARDAMAEELWQISLLVEDGDLADALERLKRAQDRVEQAIKNGATPEEIDALMQEMQQALNDYMRQQAEQNGQDPDAQTSQNGQPGMQMSQDQLQQMLDELQKLMKEGKTAEAQALMEQLREFMNNMRVTQGQGQGQGQGQPGDQAMQGLNQTLRDQQQLSDDSFRDMQQGQSGEGQQGEGDQGQDGQGRALADRQRDLQRQLDRMQQGGKLPGAGNPNGTEGRRQLDQAGRAMEDAEQALRDGDLGGALDKQAEALDALRNGIRNLGQAQAEAQQQQDGQQGQAQTGPGPEGQRDPLGRDSGDSARFGSDQSLMQGPDVYRRAQDLLDEIRKRAGEQARPEGERNYLKRLLGLF
ncbi:MAG: DUF4175 domain-containing protein [Candidatus Saccharibacteria bacterium]|nr:DUF4175 domain-containing protein [Pseudorhodobacter sp.]